MYHKILIPLDSSKLAEAPLNYATKLAAACEAELVLLHVCKPGECHLTLEGHDIKSIHQGYIENTIQRLEKELEKAGAKGIKVGSRIVDGDPAIEILRYVEENNIDLIVMATHGRSGVRRWTMGSVAVKVHRGAEIPVRLVRSLDPAKSPAEEWPERKILALLDGSERAEQVLPYVIDHVRISDGEVTLLRVIPASEAAFNYPPDMPIKWEDYLKRVTRHLKQQCSQYMGKVEDRLNDAGIPRIKTKCLIGNVAETISDYVSQNKFDLVAMTTHARSAMSVWPIGSVADKVIHGTSSPILLVRAH